MRHLGMIDTPPESPQRTHLIRSFLGLRARHGGLLVTVSGLGAHVRAGEVVCQITNVFGECVETITAPQDGYLVRTTTMASVSQSERVATLGIA
jgi:predicted deacylase